MEDDPLHPHELLPALLLSVVMLPHDYLPVPGLLAPVEAVAGAEDPLVADQGAATSEVTSPLEISLPRPGARHCLVTSNNPEQSLMNLNILMDALLRTLRHFGYCQAGCNLLHILLGREKKTQYL